MTKKEKPTKERVKVNGKYHFIEPDGSFSRTDSVKMKDYHDPVEVTTYIALDGSIKREWVHNQQLYRETISPTGERHIYFSAEGNKKKILGEIDNVKKQLSPQRVEEIRREIAPVLMAIKLHRRSAELGMNQSHTEEASVVASKKANAKAPDVPRMVDEEGNGDEVYGRISDVERNANRSAAKVKSKKEEFVMQADTLSAEDKKAVLDALKDTLVNQVIVEGKGSAKAQADLKAARERVGALVGKGHMQRVLSELDDEVKTLKNKIQEPIERTVKKSGTLTVRTEYYPKQNRIVRVETDLTKGIHKTGMETVTEILLNENKIKTYTRYQDKEGKMHYGELYGTVERVASRDGGTISKKVDMMNARDKEMWTAALNKEVMKEIKKLKRTTKEQDVMAHGDKNKRPQERKQPQTEGVVESKTSEKVDSVTQNAEQETTHEVDAPVTKLADGTYRQYDFRRKVIFETTVRSNEDGTQIWDVSEIWLGQGKRGTRYSHEEKITADGKRFIIEPEGKEKIGAKLGRDSKGIINDVDALDVISSARYNDLFNAAETRNRKYAITKAEYEYAGDNVDEAIVRKLETTSINGGFKRVVTEYNLGDGYKKSYKHVEWLDADGNVVAKDLPVSKSLLGKDMAHKTKNPTVDGRIDYDSQGNEAKMEYMTEREVNNLTKMWEHWKEKADRERKTEVVVPPKRPNWFKRNFPWLAGVLAIAAAGLAMRFGGMKGNKPADYGDDNLRRPTADYVETGMTAEAEEMDVASATVQAPVEVVEEVPNGENTVRNTVQRTSSAQKSRNVEQPAPVAQQVRSTVRPVSDEQKIQNHETDEKASVMENTFSVMIDKQSYVINQNSHIALTASGYRHTTAGAGKGVVRELMKRTVYIKASDLGPTPFHAAATLEAIQRGDAKVVLVNSEIHIKQHQKLGPTTVDTDTRLKPVMHFKGQDAVPFLKGKGMQVQYKTLPNGHVDTASKWQTSSEDIEHKLPNGVTHKYTGPFDR